MMGAGLAFLVRLATGVRLAEHLPRPVGGRLYFSNHSSHLDFVVIWAALPMELRSRVRPVAAAEYWEAGPLRRWLATKVFKAVLIPRERARMKAENPLDLMVAALEEGADLIMFPEGTRSATDEIAPFKAGLSHLKARCPDLELMPVFLENLNRMLPKGEGIPVPLMGRAVFGEPIEGPGEGEAKAEFLERSRAAVMALAGGNLTAISDEGS
jgi:1-acyl-sn-glycerol-3-phosphate acyltransferase